MYGSEFKSLIIFYSNSIVYYYYSFYYKLKWHIIIA
jgi:hypothetical protein